MTFPNEPELQPVSETERLFWSIKTTSYKTDESVWTVKQRLRKGQYKAVKSGRRTLILPDSVRAYIASLPVANFLPPKRA